MSLYSLADTHKGGEVGDALLRMWTYLYLLLLKVMADVLTTPNNDLVNELLIAKLLEDDMRELESLRAAEELQLNETLATSALAAGRFPKKAKSGVLGHTDYDVVLDVLQAEINANKDALMAQALQHADDSNMAASRQYAQRLAAAEKKCLLDTEFAKRLQQAIDDGEDNDNDMRDAERCLSRTSEKVLLLTFNIAAFSVGTRSTTSWYSDLAFIHRHGVSLADGRLGFGYE